MIYEELSGEIIGAVMEVLNQLKPGLDDPAAAGLRTRPLGMETRVAPQGTGQAQCSRSSWLNLSVISV
jgi:hypothetical protein